ncbi:MAG: signal peptidase I [Candidatus Pacebacteria bacterium]|nr:signal peptidase I [Candidatus Paceibacterota bacterium]
MENQNANLNAEIPKTTKKESFWETIRFILLAIIIVVPVRIFIAQPFVVSGSSMYPTFHNGDYLIVDELSYRLGDIERNDVVIFRYPLAPSKYFIKRVIGLPNEIIEVNDTEIKITNKKTNETITLDEPFIKNKAGGIITTYELGPDEYFVMGDNRGASSDSRYWGPVKKDFMVGQAYLRLLPLNDIDYKPGDFK